MNIIHYILQNNHSISIQLGDPITKEAFFQCNGISVLLELLEVQFRTCPVLDDVPEITILIGATILNAVEDCLLLFSCLKLFLLIIFATRWKEYSEVV